MKFIATILATAAAVKIEDYHEDDGVLVAVHDGLTAVDALDLGYTYAYDGYDKTNNLNVFNFYGAVYGDIQGIADDDGLEQLVKTKEGLVLADPYAPLTATIAGVGPVAVDAEALAGLDDDGLALAASLGGL